MSASIGQIHLDLGINSSGFKKQLNDVTKTAKLSASSMAGSFGKLAKVAVAAFSVKAIVNFSKECLSLGSDLAEVQNVVDVTFGGMSEKVNQFAKDAMTSFGMSEKVTKEYMGQFGAMSKAFGNTEAMAYDQAAALTGLAGDVASFYNMSTDEAFTKLKAVYTGETEALKSLGVVMTQAALDEYALQKGMGKTTSQMSEQEKVALRLAFVTDRLSGASGDFARTADGWANQTRVLSLRFESLKATIGQGLINALLPVIQLLNKLVSYLQIAADAFSNFTAALFGKAGNSSPVSVAAAASKELASNLGSSAASAKQIKKALAGFDQLNILSSNSDPGSGSGSGSGLGVGSSLGVGSLGDTGANAATAAVEKMKTLLGEIKIELGEFANISGLTGLWDDFLAGIETAKPGVQNLFTAFSNAMAANAPNFEVFKNSVTNTFLTMSNTISTITGDMWLIVTEGFRSFTEENGPAIEQFFTGFTESLINCWTLASDVTSDLFSELNAWWEKDGARIWTEFVDCLKDVGDWLLKLWNDHLKPIVDWIIVEARRLWDEYLKPLWSKLLNFITSLWDAIKVLWDNVLKPVVDWVLENLVPPIRDAIKDLATVVTDVIGTISTILGGIIDTLTAVLDFVVDGFTKGWDEAWEDLKKKFGEIWEGVEKTISKPLNGMLGGIESFINNIIKGLNKLIQAMNKIQVKLPDWDIFGKNAGKGFGVNIPEIGSVSLPRLATGGYVAANTPQLAVIGDNKREGEIVAPESKIAEAVAKGFAMVLNKLQGQNGPQNKQPIHLTVKLGDDDFWSGFVDYHNDVVMRTGTSPLLT